MTQYTEILRLSSQGISQRSIALSFACSRNTVAKVLIRTEELQLRWPFKNDITDGELEKQLFPEVIPIKPNHRPPDLEYIHKEMAKNGVSLKILWNEYCESCRTANELLLMYSQFCFHYQKFAQKRRATMHIHRKPGEQIEVDWGKCKVELNVKLGWQRTAAANSATRLLYIYFVSTGIFSRKPLNPFFLFCCNNYLS